MKPPIFVKYRSSIKPTFFFPCSKVRTKKKGGKKKERENPIRRMGADDEGAKCFPHYSPVTRCDRGVSEFPHSPGYLNGPNICV